MQLDKLIGISPENLLLERLRVVTEGTNKAIGCNRGPESSLLERSNPVRRAVFNAPREPAPEPYVA